MTSRIAQWTLDVQDVASMATFWAAALGYRADVREDGSAKLYPPDGGPPGTPMVWLQPSAGPKSGKNRDHPDLVAADPAAFAAEVQRLIGLGARHVDIGQSGDGLTVLADPEGNEFCVLHGLPQ